MNLTKAIKKLSEDIESHETLENAKLHLIKVLKSYEYQTQNGLDKIESAYNGVFEQCFQKYLNTFRKNIF